MATNEVTDVTLNTYTRRPVPSLEASLIVYLAQELQAIENAVKSVIEGTIQVSDNPPDKPKKGMVRYAVSPWNPLGNGYSGLVVYNGSTWVQV
jgi:hypothetical protein